MSEEDRKSQPDMPTDGVGPPSESGRELSVEEYMRLMGEIAAGAAHEINNPLTVISGRAQLMREQAQSDREREIGEVIAANAQRISDIISELMQFASPPLAQPEAIDLAAMFEKKMGEFSSTNRPNGPAVEFDKYIEDDCPQVWADPRQIEIVLDELIRNAITAGGRQPRISVQVGSGDQGMVRLEIRDRGCGMDADLQSAAFTPFYSRRPAGRGRGLGLPLVWRYTRNNRGRVWIESAPAVGTSVFVLLPAHEPS